MDANYEVLYEETRKQINQKVYRFCGSYSEVEEQIKITFSLLSCTELSFCLWYYSDSIL